MLGDASSFDLVFAPVLSEWSNAFSAQTLHQVNVYFCSTNKYLVTPAKLEFALAMEVLHL